MEGFRKPGAVTDLNGVRTLLHTLQHFYGMALDGVMQEEVALKSLLDNLQKLPAVADLARDLKRECELRLARTFKVAGEALEHLDARNNDAFALQFISVGTPAAPAASASGLPAAPMEPVRYARFMAATNPTGTCTMHKHESHAWEDCPLVAGDLGAPAQRVEKPPRRSQATAHVTQAEDTPSDALARAVAALSTNLTTLPDTLVKAVADSVHLAVGEAVGRVHELEQDATAMAVRHDERRQPGAPYGQQGYRAAPRRSASECTLCGHAGHEVPTCWVLRPDFVLQAGAIRYYADLPPHLKAVFQESCRRLNLRPPATSPPDPSNPDAYPPRPGGDAHYNALCIVVEGAEVSASVCASEQPVVAAFAASASLGEAGASRDAAAGNSTPVVLCGCGATCMLTLSTADGTFGQPMWSCPERRDVRCVVGAPLSGEPPAVLAVAAAV